MVSQRALTIIILLVTALAGRSEEARAAPTQNSDVGSLSEARKSFENLRDAKGTKSESAPNPLSALVLPDLNVAADGPKPARRAQPATPQKSRNWLVDGVLGSAQVRNYSLGQGSTERGPLGSTTGGISGSAPDGQGAAIATEREPPEEQSQQSAQAENAERRPLPNSPVINPLDEFLQSWISPQDRPLLLPSGSGFGGTTTAAIVESGASQAVAAPSRLSENGRKFVPAIQAGDNPYLSIPPSISESKPGQAQLTPPQIPTAIASASSGNPLQPPAAALRASPNKPSGREFGKQDDSGKYFRQLNRF